MTVACFGKRWRARLRERRIRRREGQRARERVKRKERNNQKL